MRLHQNVCYLCGEAMGRGIKGYVTHLMMHIEKILNPDMPYQPPPNAKCHKDQLPIDPNSKSRDLLCPHCEVHFRCVTSNKRNFCLLFDSLTLIKASNFTIFSDGTK